MIKLKSQKKILCFLTIILAATSLGFSDGLVWCHCDDGHVHAEISIDGFNCRQLPSTSPTSGTDNDFIRGGTSFSDGSCDCIGVHYSKDYFLRKSITIRSFFSQSITPVCTTLQCLLSIILTQDINFRPLKIPLPILSFLRSTILLI
jgi:hypothetical protein